MNNIGDNGSPRLRPPACFMVLQHFHLQSLLGDEVAMIAIDHSRLLNEKRAISRSRKKKFFLREKLVQ